MVLKEAGKWVSGKLQEVKVNECVRTVLNLGLLKKRFIQSFQELYVNNFPEKWIVSESGKDRR